jgi:pantoate--beta-alanine ligase
VSLAEVAHTPWELRELLGSHAPGLVPTMGALHEGHLTLIRRSAMENDRTVVSIFVNPLQFNDAGDLAAYPRTFDEDRYLASEAGATILFAPSEAVLYPEGFATTVTVSGVTETWEGAVRPGHFAGVTTVVTKLFTIVHPANAYFGEKDFQQLVVIRRLHADLNLPGRVIGVPTVRDAEGLALSSRNARLSPDERKRAAVIPRALMTMRDRASTGERSAAEVLALGHEILGEEPSLTVDYLAIVDPATLEPVEEILPGTRALAAVRSGATRLLDNVALLEE